MVTKLCVWCQQHPVKRMRHACCSLSCASQKRWAEMCADGRLQRVIGGRTAQVRNRQTQRLMVEIDREVKALGLVTELGLLRRFYVRARNHGYHAGYGAATKRMRNGSS